MTDHNFTPPLELVHEWLKEFYGPKLLYVAEASIHLATRAAQWGADIELEACCEWLEDVICEDPQDTPDELRAARRPKPPSLKEEALKGFGTIAGIVLDEYSGTTFYEEYKKVTDTICRALEQLND